MDTPKHRPTAAVIAAVPITELATPNWQHRTGDTELATSG
jgi:hypothetical protein